MASPREPTPSGIGVGGQAVPQEQDTDDRSGTLVLERPDDEALFYAALSGQRRYSAALLEASSPVIRYWNGRARILGRCPCCGCPR